MLANIQRSRESIELSTAMSPNAKAAAISYFDNREKIERLRISHLIGGTKG